MATESSAVVRFISLAQQAQNPVRPTTPAPITSDFGTEVVREIRPRRSRAPLIVGALALAGVATAGGVLLGKNGLGGSDGPKAPDSPARAAAAAPLAGAERAESQPAAPAPAPAEPAADPAPVPQVTSPVVSAPADVLAATGFDIRVQPGATITLDGAILGKAPLRVRNLQPGAHVLDIEAPAGFFSRRVELPLAAGEAKDLRLSLDPIEDDAVAADPAQPSSKSSSKSSRRSRADLRRERKEKAREEQERKKEMRAARVAAARAARQAKADRSEKRAAVVAEPLPDEPKAKSSDSEKMSDADAELEAAMADIVGKPAPRRSVAAAAGASSMATTSAPSISSSGKGTLMLGSKPPCDIILDGKPTGLKTPQRAMELSSGTHSVVLVNAELGLEKKFKVKIAPGKTTKAIQDLTDKID